MLFSVKFCSPADYFL